MFYPEVKKLNNLDCGAPGWSSGLTRLLDREGEEAARVRDSSSPAFFQFSSDKLDCGIRRLRISVIGTRASCELGKWSSAPGEDEEGLRACAAYGRERIISVR